MYEFSITGTLLIVAVFLVVLLREDLRFLGTFVTGLVLILLGLAAVNYYVGVAPLPPALQSAWLVIHVFVAILGTAFFALGVALSVHAAAADHGATRAATREPRSCASSRRCPTPTARAPGLPRQHRRLHLLDLHAHRRRHLGRAAWGRYWGWDTKEVWTFIIWVIYAGYIHARATRGWRGRVRRGSPSSGSRPCCSTSAIVNVFFKGLHAYAGL